MALLALCGTMTAIFWGPQKSLATVPRAPGDRNILRVAYTQILVPDPHQRSFPFPSANLFILSLWEPLVECDPATGQPRPAAAQSWEWSTDRLSLTLKLRPNARWSNGDQVTAQDFVRGWHRLLRQRIQVAQNLFPLKNAEAYHLGRIKDADTVGVRALDDLTLRLELEQVRSTLVSELADPLLSPLHRTDEKVLKEHLYFGQPGGLVTNGPFRLIQANYDGYRLATSEFYHGRSEIRLAGVHFIRADSLSVAPLLLAAGVVDVLTPTPFGVERAKPTTRQIVRTSELVLAVSALDFNVARGPLQDVRVRRALALALDRVGSIAEFDSAGRMVPAWSWVPSMPGRTGLVLLKEDANEARQLLASAGFPDGKGFPVLHLALPLWMQGDPYPAAWAERWFRELGVRTHVVYEPQPLMAKRSATGDYDVVYGTLIATVPDAGDLLSVFRMPARFSNTKWNDKDVICSLAEADTQTGAERLAILEKAERLAMAQVPSVPMMFERRQVMLAAEVKGWYPDPLARQSLKRLWLAGESAQDYQPTPRS